MAGEDFRIGGLQNNMEISGAQAMNMSALGGMSIPYQFGDITRANFGKGSETGNISKLIASWTDSNAVGLGRNIFNPEEGNRFHYVT